MSACVCVFGSEDHQPNSEFMKTKLKISKPLPNAFSANIHDAQLSLHTTDLNGLKKPVQSLATDHENTEIPQRSNVIEGVDKITPSSSMEFATFNDMKTPEHCQKNTRKFLLLTSDHIKEPSEQFHERGINQFN